MVIDFHVHMFPDKLAEKTIALLAERSGLPPYSNGSVAQTLQKAEQQGVSKIVHQNIATNPKQMKNVNDFAIRCNQDEKIISFGSVHPDSPDYAAELDRLKDAGIKGIKLHPDYQDFFIDDDRMLPIYEAILKRGFILLFHAGLDYGLPEPVHAAPKATARVIKYFSGEKVVLAHMGGFRMPERVMEHLIGEDVYIDTSCSTGFMDRETLLTLLKAHNPDKILFATDFPWGSFTGEIKAIRSLGLSEEFTEKILHKNAEKLLNL